MTNDKGSRGSSPQLSHPIIVSLWEEDQERSLTESIPLFTDTSVAIVWGMQPKAVQSMLDFDHLCSRKTPSVAAMVYPFRYKVSIISLIHMFTVVTTSKGST